MKLLTEQELRKQFENIILSWSSSISGQQRTQLPPEADELLQMIITTTQLQKQAYADMVIGEDEKTIGYGKHDGEYEYHTHRNQLRAEQRERNKL